MSTASIPINVEMLLTSSKAQAELRAFESQIQQFTQKLTKGLVDIPLKLDTGDAAVQIDEFTKSLTGRAVLMPVGINDTLARAQLANLIADMTKSAVMIPIQFINTGGMPTISPMGAAIPAMTAAGTATAAMMLPPGSAAKGFFPPGTTFTPSTAIAPPAPYANTAAGSAAATAAAAAAGGGGAAEGEGGFFNMRTFRKAMVGMMAAEAAYHMGSAVVDGVQAGLTGDNAMNAEYIKSGQDSMKKLPVVGDAVVGLGEWIQRGGSAALNGQLKGKGGYSNSAESDLGYGERVTAEAKAQDERTKEIRKGAEIIKRVNEGLEKQVIANNREAAVGGIVGSFDRARKLDDVKRDELAEELKKSQYHNRKGGLTDEAVAYRDSELARLAADAARRGVTEKEIGAETADSVNVATLENAGNMSGARKAEFDAAMRKRSAEAYKVSNAHGQYFDRTVTPVLAQAFTDSEDRRSKAGSFELGDSEEDARVRSQVAGLEMIHRADLAGELATDAAVDRRVEKIRQAAELEQDGAKKSRLQLEAGYARAAGEEEKKANHQRIEEGRALRIEGMGSTAAQNNFRAQGRGDMATFTGIRDHTLMDLQASRGDKTMQLAELNVGRSQLAEFIHGQDHPQVFNSWSGYMSHVQQSVLEHDPAAMKDAAATLKLWDSTAMKWDKIADKLDNIPTLSVIE